MFGQFEVGNLESARAVFNELLTSDSKWDVLFWIERRARGRPSQKEMAAFLSSLVPADDAKRARHLMTLLGQQYLRINAKDEAKLAFEEATKFHSMLGKEAKEPLNPTNSEGSTRSPLIEGETRASGDVLSWGHLAGLPVFLGSAQI
jgi:hypothetical protein